MNYFYKIVLLSCALLLQGCVSNPLHYYWSYVPLHNPQDDMFIQTHGKVQYLEVDDMEKTSAEMHTKGYIMVGYCYMDSPQFNFAGINASKQWGEKVGAETVALKYGKGIFLATYWSKPKTFIFGAYYQDIPRNTMQNGVIVTSIVDQSPAYHAAIKPGDILLYIKGEPIRNAHMLNTMLDELSGKEVEIIILPQGHTIPMIVRTTLGVAI